MQFTKCTRFAAVTLAAALLFPAVGHAADTDDDGLDDEWEREHFGDIDSQDGDGDPDRDGLTNRREEELGTNPVKIDTDGDFLRDGREVSLGTDPLSKDTDEDGLNDATEVRVLETDPLDPDTDGGGSPDGIEIHQDGTDPTDPSDDQLDQDGDGLTRHQERQLGTSDSKLDSDGDGIPDAQEDANGDGEVALDPNGNGVFEPSLGEETDPADADTDDDGLEDGLEINAYNSDPYDSDTDDDGLEDGVEHQLRQTTDPCLEPAVADSDYDGLEDGEEIDGSQQTDACNADTDGDGIYDAIEVADGTDPTDADDHLQDTDGDGLTDRYEQMVSETSPTDADTDGDGLEDAEEVLPLDDHFVTDPTDADTDDDGILDGNEGGVLVRGNVKQGTSPVAFDTDGDGLSDGLERGLTAPQQSAKDPDATDPARFVADSDPSSTTDPLQADTDGDGLEDGTEDADGDGARDSSETDPTLFDTDGDGLDDGWERRYSSSGACADSVDETLDPLDDSDASRDLDDDGLTSLEEYRVTHVNAEGKVVVNRTNPCDPDSDDDGLDDGTEVDSRYGSLGSTDPNDPDTDGDGLEDGFEDTNGDGEWQFDEETNPLNPDTDGDGLDDGTETNVLATDPLDTDTDDDGLPDGLEVGVKDDEDPSTHTDPIRPDTDRDGLPDGLEDTNANGRVDDGETDPLLRDTDGDGLSDGEEDADADGEVDDNETDPLDPDTDDGGVPDGTEVDEHGTDPLDGKDDLTADPDNDGLINREEHQAGTDYLDPDTDGDNISDYDEVGPDPSDPRDTDGDGDIDALDLDSDGDGVPDEREAGDDDWMTPPRDSDDDGIADYRELDSDDGGVPDRIEVHEYGTDPTDPSDDGIGYFEGPVGGGAGCGGCASTNAPSPVGLGWLLLAVVLLGARRRGRRRQTRSTPGLLLVAASFVSLIAFSIDATAQEHADARNTSLDANPYRLDPAGIGVLSTGSAESLTHLEFRTSAVGHHVSHPLVVRPDGEAAPGSRDGSRRALVEQRQQIDLSAAIGLFDRAEIGFVLPVTVAQKAQLPGFGLGRVDSRGIGNTEVYGLINLLSQRDGPLAVAVGAPVYLPTRTGDGYFGHSDLAAAPQLRLTRRFGPLRLAASGDVLFQRPSSLHNVADGRKIRWKSGLLVQPTDRWGVGAEFVGSTPLAVVPDTANATRGEVVIGGRFRPHRKIDVQLAVGRGVLRGVGAPDFRTLLSLSFHTGRPNRGPNLARCRRAEEGNAQNVPPHGCPEADFDDDGLVNSRDECPRQPEDIDGFEDDDGCPDPDNDGDQIADADDQCPNVPEDRDGFADEDGCPDLDNDGDGFADTDDACPDAPEGFDGFKDGDGCPDRDNDNDGLSDLNDECPNDAGKVEADGCPDQQAPEARVTEERIEISEKIFFVSDRAIIRDRSHPVLEEVGKALKDHPAIELIEIRGYADERGKSKYNYYLSWERAKVVRQYLIDHAGISPGRLEAAGYGVWQAAESGEQVDEPDRDGEGGGEAGDDSESEKEWAKARRVEFKILERSEDDEK